MKIFLDLDGPILDNSYRYHSIYADLLKEGGYIPLSRTEYWQYKRNRVPEREILVKTCPEFFIESYIKKRLELIENIHYLRMDSIQVGVVDTIGPWSQEHELYLVTMRKNGKALLDQLGYLNLEKCFRNIYYENNNDGSWKVKYRLMSQVADKPDSSIIIGDTEADIEAGKACRCTTIVVTCGIRTRECLMGFKPDYICENVKSIMLNRILSSLTTPSRLQKLL